MEKVLIIGCKRAMDDVCMGCYRSMVGFNRRDGAFGRYDQDAELIGLLNCGDCPGATIDELAKKMAIIRAATQASVIPFSNIAGLRELGIIGAAEGVNIGFSECDLSYRPDTKVTPCIIHYSLLPRRQKF